MSALRRLLGHRHAALVAMLAAAVGAFAAMYALLASFVPYEFRTFADAAPYFALLAYLAYLRVRVIAPQAAQISNNRKALDEQSGAHDREMRVLSHRVDELTKRAERNTGALEQVLTREAGLVTRLERVEHEGHSHPELQEIRRKQGRRRPQ